MTIIDTVADINPELAAAVTEDRLCTCNCRQVHHGDEIVCDLIATVPGGVCGSCDVDMLNCPADIDDRPVDYTLKLAFTWRVLTVSEAVDPVHGRLVVNATWRGRRVYHRPAAIRVDDRITHVGMVAAVHPAHTCPDLWDGAAECFPWGRSAPSRPTLAHWQLTDVTRLSTAVPHKFAAWMTPRTWEAVIDQL